MVRMEKKCFKCGEVKPLSEFYVHKMMADGHLGKCKSCTKRDVSERTEIKQQDPKWVNQERIRCREKMKRRRELGFERKPTLSESKKYNSAWRSKDPTKRRAELIAYRALKMGRIIKGENCEHCGQKIKLEMHHPDYSKPLEVQWLCTKCHGITRRKKA